ncbi:MAG: RDD family protein [Myxococcaceae bacterium]
MSSGIRSPAASTNDVRAEPAALWRRALAYFVDALALFLVFGTYLSVALAVTGARAPTQLGGLDGFMARLHAIQRILLPGAFLFLVLAFAYCAACAFLFRGQTLGRMVAGISLVDETGHPPVPTRAFVRAILALVSVLPGFLGYWLALFDRKGQALHDKLTSTYVVKLRSVG